jgi:thymidylate kinase
MSLTARADAPTLARAMTVQARGIAPLGGGPLLERLAKALEERGVLYCQWKGHWSAHRWAAGLGDVDLLVDHESRTEFQTLAASLGFKSALPPGERQLPGVESYLGHDPVVPRLLHLHVHYRLVLGEFWRTTYRIPIERPMLETAAAGTFFRVPDPTYQFIVFVLRMVLLQQGRPLLAAATRWRRSIQIQLNNLEGITERQALATVLSRYLPSIDLPLFDRCVASLRGECGALERALLPDQLHQRLRPYARRPSLASLLSATADKVLPPSLRRKLVDERMRFAGGGTVIALVGGDGAGKSTSATELALWLAPHIVTKRAHLGHPPRSLLTLAVGGALKCEQWLYRRLGLQPRAASYLELLRHVCTARDCFRLYQRVHRFAANGGVVVCERYPVRQVRAHVGPCIPALIGATPPPLARVLQAAESNYYSRILAADALFVLQVDPELAVLRKPDEPANYVRARVRAAREADWSGSSAHVVDASRSFPEVLNDLKSRLWTIL